MTSNPLILIADDDTALLDAISLRLESIGYRTATTQDGYQALAIARKESPDLLILDINMPAGSGISVLKRIHAIDELAEVPVIFITGYDIQSLPSDILEHQNARLIQKPFDTGTLLATIHECLEPANLAPAHIYEI